MHDDGTALSFTGRSHGSLQRVVRVMSRRSVVQTDKQDNVSGCPSLGIVLLPMVYPSSLHASRGRQCCVTVLSPSGHVLGSKYNIQIHVHVVSPLWHA